MTFIVGHAEQSICRVSAGNNIANANLLSSAPDLLSALEFLCEITEPPPESNCSCHLAPPCGDCVEYGALREALAMAEASIKKAKGN
jgi:hypothetical protein